MGPSAQQLIREAFASVPLPKTTREIAPHPCVECDRLAADLLGHHWSELTEAVIDYHSDSLPLLAPTALHHYLAAWLLRALAKPDSDVMGFLVFHIADARMRGCIHLYDVKQREAVLGFLSEVDAKDFNGEPDRARSIWTPADTSTSG